MSCLFVSAHRRPSDVFFISSSLSPLSLLSITTKISLITMAR